MENIINDIKQTLEMSVDEKTKRDGRRVFKEEIIFYGVRIPDVNKISRDFFELIKDQPKERIYALCEELWKTGYNEDSYIACNWSYYIHAQYTREDFEVFERWVEWYVTNWASCDTLCNHTVGEFLEMYPEYVQRLKT